MIINLCSPITVRSKTVNSKHHFITHVIVSSSRLAVDGDPVNGYVVYVW
jgi:hypothetical protein